MYAIEKGTLTVDRLPVVVLHAGSEPLAWPPAAQPAGTPERWTLIDAPAAGRFRASPAPALLLLGRRGRTTVHADGLVLPLEAGARLVTEPGARVDACGAAGASFVALALPPRALARIAASALGRTPASPLLFASAGAADEVVAPGELAQLERALSGAAPDWIIAELADAWCARLVEREQRHAAALAQTCGRTERHRRHLYARLNRVRLLVEHGAPRDYTMRALADVAHLSVWHFVRSFGRVFGETPHRFLTRIRLESAARMLAEGDEPIARIAERHGFENRCAFARLFRAHFGIAASGHRRAARLAGFGASPAALRAVAGEVRAADALAA